MIHRIIPEKMDIAVGGGGAATLAGNWAGVDVIVGEGGTALVKRAKQQKCDTSAVTTPVFGLYLVGTSCQVPLWCQTFLLKIPAPTVPAGRCN